jgi:DHA3 family macrolide efflux protein-like MFS transporter
MSQFFVIWTGQAFSLFGSELVQFALVWWLTERTGSATVLAFATMMALLPQVFLSPFAGALVDRWPRRRVMIVADGVIALASVILAVLFRLELVRVWHVYAVMFIRSAGGAFHWPAMQASTPLMVPEKHLSRIAGLNQALYGAAGIVTPPLGALLLQLFPIHAILGIDVGTALLAIVPLLFIAIPQPAATDHAPRASGPLAVLADLREGLRFVWGWRGLVLILGMAALLNFLVNPAFALLPILVTDHFGGGALQLAWLQSAWGLGMLAGGLTLSVWGGFKRRVVTAMLALVLQGVGITILGFAPATGLLLAIGALFFAGFMNPMVNGSFFAALQAVVPPQMQGRVFTLIISASAAMSPLGLAVAGPVADTISAQAWFVIGGVAAVLMGSAMFFIPAVMRIEDRTPYQIPVRTQ